MFHKSNFICCLGPTTRKKICAAYQKIIDDRQRKQKSTGVPADDSGYDTDEELPTRQRGDLIVTSAFKQALLKVVKKSQRHQDEEDVGTSLEWLRDQLPLKLLPGGKRLKKNRKGQPVPTVSDRTMFNALRAIGVHWRALTKRHYVSKAQAAKRKSFCKKYKGKQYSWFTDCAVADVKFKKK
jgi:hypothetical protein